MSSVPTLSEDCFECAEVLYYRELEKSGQGKNYRVRILKVNLVGNVKGENLLLAFNDFKSVMDNTPKKM